jgi:uncharacterized protein YfiM (DUF2279 family)
MQCRRSYGRRAVIFAVGVAGVVLTAAGAAAQDRWFAPDKALHFAAGAALGAGGYALGSMAFDGRDRRVAVGLSIGIGAGAAKELRDRGSGGTASWRDLAWTAGGAGLGVTTAWLIDRASYRREAPAPAPEAFALSGMAFRTR